MKQTTSNSPSEQPANGFSGALDEILRQGAQKMRMNAIEAEVASYIDSHASQLDENGRRLVVRSGYLPEREIITGIGSVEIRQLRVRDRRENHRFSSRILPPFMRRVPSVEALIPCLYLKGISTGDFSEALAAILGPQVPGLSATNIVRLKEIWKTEYDQWKKRDLNDKRYVYIWVDGIHFNVRLDDQRSCILVVIGATKDGKKELLAVQDGYRESKLSWQEILKGLKDRHLQWPPALAVGDGSLGFWSALDEEFPTTRRQRCWVHKTANILDKMPKSVQGKAKEKIFDMYMAGTRENALKAYNAFITLYQAKYPRACDCLIKDKDDLFTFYDFLAEHWTHIRTTNPIESTFATVRLRTKRTKGCGSRSATLMMVFKLVEQAENRWRKLNKHEYIPLVIRGDQFINGVLADAA